MLKQLFRDSAVYTVATLLTTGLSFVLLPIYARVLTPAQYGLFDYITVVGLLVGVTVALEVAQGMMYFVTQEKDETVRTQLIAAGVRVHGVAYLAFSAVAVVFSNWIADHLLGTGADHWLVTFSALQFFAVALVRVWTVVERSLLRPWRVLRISVGSAALAGVLGALGALSWGVTGLMAGQFVGQGVVAVVLVVVYRRQVIRRVGSDVVRKLLSFSAPLVFSSVAFLLATYVDRLLVKQMLGLEELGFYSLGARVASGVTLLLVGFQSALGPLIYSSLDREGVHEDVARVFRMFAAVAGAALLVLMLTAPLIVQVAGGDEYAPAVPVLRLLAAAALIQGSYIFFPGLYIARKTGTLALVHCVGVALNAGLNIVLIPRWELVGSGIAALVGAAAIFGMNAVLAQRYFEVPVFRRSSATRSAAGNE